MASFGILGILDVLGALGTLGILETCELKKRTNELKWSHKVSGEHIELGHRDASGKELKNISTLPVDHERQDAVY